MNSSKSIVWINVFTAKPGKLDELVTTEAEELLNFKDIAGPGWISSRWHRSLDKNKAIMITAFESIEYHKRLLEKTDIKEHINKMKDLIEETEGGYYTLVESVEPCNSPIR